MDGFKKRLSESIQLRLSVWLTAAILVVAVVAGVFSFAAAFDEAHELQDDTLRQVAALFDRHALAAPSADAQEARDTHDEEANVIVQFLDTGAPRPRGGDLPLALPAGLADGLHTLESGGETFRVMVRTLGDGRRVAVAQETGARNEIARDSALRTLTPFLLLMPILLLVVADLVRKMFRPIATLAHEIDQRDEQALHPVAAERLPLEVRPFATAINRLLDRVARAMDAQRRFVADAAHELRSPLTALSLQAEHLAATPLPLAAQERLASLREGIARGRSLLDQLLTLARAEAGAGSARTPVAVHAVFREVLADLLPLADAKGMDLGIEGAADVTVLTDATDLRIVIKNLVDNAIRYTPPGGRVDVSADAEGGQALLRVRDTGPGIPPAERARVFDPFYRVLGSEQTGSGLGLSIVRTLAARLGAETTLTYADEPAARGLCVSLRLPLAPAAPSSPTTPATASATASATAAIRPHQP